MPRYPGRSEKKVLTSGVTPSARGEGIAAYPFGASPGWAVGLFLVRARMAPPALLSFFLFFLFSFSVFLILSKLFQNRFKSIQSKEDNFINFKTIF
jgi:hypothetical protein